MLEIETILLFGFPAVALVGAIVEILKRLAKEYKKEIPKRFLPLVSILIAVILFVLSGGGVIENIIMGLIVGLSASGGYDLVKSVKK